MSEAVPSAAPSGHLHDPARFAALVAPVVDRVVISVHQHASARLDEVRRCHAVEGPIGSLVELRLALLAGPVPRSAFDAVARYVPLVEREAELAAQVGAGRLVIGERGELVATERACALLAALVGAYDDVVVEHWAYGAVTVDDLGRLERLAARAMAAGRASGGAAYGLMGVAPIPGTTSPAFQLWSRLSALRYHRADAHAAAAANEGLTPAALVTLACGGRRRRVEDTTNERSGGVWAALDPGERLELLAGLGAL